VCVSVCVCIQAQWCFLAVRSVPAVHNRPSINFRYKPPRP